MDGGGIVLHTVIAPYMLSVFTFIIWTMPFMATRGQCNTLFTGSMFFMPSSFSKQIKFSVRHILLLLSVAIIAVNQSVFICLVTVKSDKV